MFEQAVLSRTFFDPSALLVCQDDAGVQAWCHLITDPRSEQVGCLAAFCAVPTCDDGAPAALLAEVERRCRDRGIGLIAAGVVRDSDLGYAGLDPYGHGVGVSTNDLRTQSLLQQAGYEHDMMVSRLVVVTAGYRPPVNRESMQLRRSARIESTDVVFDEPRHASAMAHFDVHHYRLLDQRGDEVADLRIWLSDPEAEVMNPAHAILDVGRAQERGTLDGPGAYLIGQVIQLLAQRNVETVETAIDDNDQAFLDQMRDLRFQVTDSGIRWRKVLG